MSASDTLERPVHDRRRSRMPWGDRRARGGRPAPALAALVDRVLRADPRVRTFLAVAVAATVGKAAADLLPRGPVTTAEALLTMATVTIVGLAVGVLVARRWALLLGPVVFLTLFELGRLEAVGPTVDLPRLTLLGVLLWAGVRLLLGVVMVAPMVVGAAWGVRLAHRRGGHAPARGRVRTAVLVLVTLALVAVAALIAAPASTAPITGSDGQPVPGSIAELTTVEIDGHQHALMIRGVSTDNPVLLHLAGGPGGTDIGAMRLDAELEQHFVVVTWDQRGTGKSYGAIEPVDTLTIEGAVADTLAVTDHLRERFAEERIVITGQSWGTIPAVLAAQRHPERYAAVVSTGQMVDVAETDRIFYDDVLANAHERGDVALEERLLVMGPPPYEHWEDNLALNGAEREAFVYPEFDGHTEMTATLLVPENALMDVVGGVRGLADTFTLLYPQLQQLDLRSSVPALDVPVYVVVGEHESRGRVEPARAWFDALDAPVKEWIELPASGHRASFEQPAVYAELLVRVRQHAFGN